MVFPPSEYMKGRSPNATYIDHYVVAAVRELTEEVAWQAREASSLAAFEFTGEAVKLKLGVAEKPWWRLR